MNKISGNVERLLCDALERIRRSPQGRVLAHIRLSRLQPYNRGTVNIKIAARMFAPLEEGYLASVFRLSNADIAVLGDASAAPEIDKAVARLRALFENDPLVYGKDGTGFATIHDLGSDLAQVLEVAYRLLDDAERRSLEPSLPEAPQPISSARLAQLHDRLDGMDVSLLLRRQPAVRAAGDQPTILFEEFFVSVHDLAAEIAPKEDIVTNPWLFHDLMSSVDRRALAALEVINGCQRPSRLSVNLSLVTLFGPEFARFVASLAEEQKLIVEVQVLDALVNPKRFQKARDALRAAGHAILVDGVSPAAMRLANLAALDPDMIKILWSRDLMIPPKPGEENRLRTMVQELGSERVVLARCDSAYALKRGAEAGIFAFQGRFLDSLRPGSDPSACRGRSTCAYPKCVLSGRRAKGPPEIRQAAR